MSAKPPIPFDPATFEATRAPLRNARHLPGEIYTSPELFEREKEAIFMSQWVCVARVEEIEKPGDYLTFRVMGESVIAASRWRVGPVTPGGFPALIMAGPTTSKAN